MARLVNVDDIHTPSQEWAAAHNACISGRRRLGHMSIGEYFRSPKADPSDLVWIAQRLHTSDPHQRQEYRDRALCIWVGGRWILKHTRERLLNLFEIYSVIIPARLL